MGGSDHRKQGTHDHAYPVFVLYHDIHPIGGKSVNIIKRLLQDSRHTMVAIFDHHCALINKSGVCHQCSELNGWFNPKKNRQESLNRLDLVRGSINYNREILFTLRTKLVKAIDPMRGRGSALQDMLIRYDRLAMGEVDSLR